jgi:hypothetical protein
MPRRVNSVGLETKLFEYNNFQLSNEFFREFQIFPPLGFFLTAFCRNLPNLILTRERTHDLSPATRIHRQLDNP